MAMRSFPIAPLLAGLIFALPASSTPGPAPLPSVVDLGASAGNEGTPVARVFGAVTEVAPSDTRMRSLAAGDFNGDGYDDALLATGRSAYIVYGRAETPASTVSLEIVGAVSAFGLTRIRTTTTASAFSGVGAGDFNGDGLSDAVVCDATNAYIVYGDVLKPGLADGAGSVVAVTPTGLSSSAGETRLEFGAGLSAPTVAAGDFDGDGYDDLVLGDKNSALVRVLYGHPAKPGTPNGAGTMVVSLSQQQTGAVGETLIKDLPTVPDAVAAGDMDGDGYDDLAFGMGLANVPNNVDAGVVILIHGTPNRLGVANAGRYTYSLASAAVGVPSNNGETRILGDDGSDRLGTGLAFGDLNGDGFSDLAMGVPQGDANTLLNPGEVYVLYGGAVRVGEPAGAGRLINLAVSTGISAAGETRIYGGVANAQLGTSVAIADLDGDGYGDLQAAAPFDTPQGRTQAGVAHVLYGGPDRLGIPIDSGTAFNLFNDPADVQIQGPLANANLGFGLHGSGDFNRDGFADLFIGSVLEGKALPNTLGSLNIVYGGGDAATAESIAAFPAGPTPRKGLGGTLSPVLRAQLQFDDGEAGSAAITLARAGGDALDILGEAPLSPLWQLTANRVDWTSGTLTVQYTNADLGAAQASAVGAWVATSPAGPWTVPLQSANVNAQTVTLPVLEDSYVVLAANFNTLTIEPALNQVNPAVSLPVVFQVTFQSPVTGLLATDFTFAGSASVEGAELLGSGAQYTLKVFDIASDGTVQPELAAGLVFDSLGRPNAFGTSAESTVGFGAYPPHLTLNGSDPTQTSCQESFVDPGVVALDGLEGDLSGEVDFEDSETAGDPLQFTRTYTVTDSFGQSASITRTVVLTAAGPPIITRNGGNLVLECGDAYVELGATAVESCSGTPLSVQIYNPVDATTPGEYFVLYRATDSLGRSTQVTRRVRVLDTLVPVITLVGNAVLTVSCKSPFIDPGATALDTCESDLSAQVTATGLVNTNAPGTYSIRYKLIDASGNEAGDVTRTVHVVDAEAPLMSLIGGPALQVTCGSPLEDPGVIAVDACAGDLSGSVERLGEVDTETPGEYAVQYTLADGSGNTARPVYRTFHVVDNAPPVLTLMGDGSMSVECHAGFTDPGAAAMDACEGDLSGNIVVTGIVDAETVGTYTLTYTVIDSAGHPAEKAVREIQVEDKSAPVVTLLGESTVTLTCGDEYTDAGATAEDACEGSLDSVLKTYNSVDPDVAGTYAVMYTARDSAGNEGSAMRTVIVEDTAPPSIQIAGLETEACAELAEGADLCYTAVLECHADLSGILISASDTCDGDQELLPRVTEWASTSGPATYQQRYTAEDAAGNVVVMDLTIVVVDSTPPVLTLRGSDEVTWSCGITYFDAGFTAVDDCDGDLKEQVVVSGLDALDGMTPGDFTVTYSVLDASGNEMVATRLVHVEGPCRGLVQSADTNEDGKIQLTELQRVVQFYNIGGYHCSLAGSEDGYEPGIDEDVACNPHNTDYDPQDWEISLSELLRLIQFYQATGYQLCDTGEDGYCPVLAE